jgi:Zinc finger, C2H2 type
MHSQIKFYIANQDKLHKLMSQTEIEAIYFDSKLIKNELEDIKEEAETMSNFDETEHEFNMQELEMPSFKKPEKVCQSHKSKEKAARQMKKKLNSEICGIFKKHQSAKPECNKDVLICDLCGHTSCNKNSLKKHLRTHANIRYECTSGDCKKVFKSKTAFEYHTKIYHQKFNKQYECEICHVKFRLKSYLSVHKSAIHPVSPEEKPKHPCEGEN